MRKNFFEEMRWRRMISGQTYGIESMFSASSKHLVAYIGFDPTAEYLHIGNLAAINMLRHFQLCGHKPLVIVGGGTGFIGDPAGKTSERKFLTKEKIESNLQSLKREFSKFLDFSAGEMSAEILNNLDWLGEISLIHFLREYGKSISVNEMIKRDSVRNRIADGGISFTEFTYQALQAFDFYWLRNNKDCRLQMGGSDQWGNIVAGIDLINKKSDFDDVHGLTLPLIEKKGGGKFGKTEEGNVWLNDKLTSPYKFFQFWRNVSDEDIPKLLRVFTFLNENEIIELDNEAVNQPNKVKDFLAEYMVKYVYSSESYEKAKSISTILYGQNTIEDIEKFDDAFILDSAEGMNIVTLTREELAGLKTNIDLVSKALSSVDSIVSKSETRRLIEGDAIKINKKKVELSAAWTIPDYKLIKEKFLLLQKGKVFYLLVIGKD